MKKPRIGSRWRYTGIAGNEYDRVVESTGSGGEMLYRAFSEGVDLGLCSLSVDKFTDRCVPLDPDPWEPEVRAMAVGQRWRDNDSGCEVIVSSVRDVGASRYAWVQDSMGVGVGTVPLGANDVPRGYAWEFVGEAKPERPKVRVGQVWELLVLPPERATVERINVDTGQCELRNRSGELLWMSIDRSGFIEQTGCWTLVRDVEEPATEETVRIAMDQVVQATFESLSKMSDADRKWADAQPWPNAPAQPSPRPGQRWSDGRYEYQLLDVDELPGNRAFLARRDDGLRVVLHETEMVGDSRVAEWKFKSGPTEQETSQQAIERVVKLEAEYVPVGCTAGWWLANLIGDTERGLENENPSGDHVRRQARIKRGNAGPWQGAQRWEAGR